MKIFVDANILVSVLNKEYPLFTYTSRILSLNENSKFQIYTSPICLAIAFYFAEKKHKAVAAKKKIQLLNANLDIAENTVSSVRKSLENKKIHDFEDGLEYYAALENKCNCIITEDVKDFYFSEMEVISAEDFWNRYVANIKA